MSADLRDTRFCVVDGVGGDHADDAAVGLRLDATEIAGDRLVASFVLRPEHQGGRGRAHGGALLTALDEVMGRLAWLALDRNDCLTVSFSAELKRAALLGHRLDVVARLVRREGRKLWLEGEVRDGEDVLCTATGLWLVPRVGTVPA